jgi:hypothetical protein
MFRKANNVFSVVLSDASALTSALNTAVPVGTVVTNLNLPIGAVAVCDMGMRRLDNTSYTALAATDKFFIVQGKGATQPLMKSPAMTKANVTISASKFKAAVQQVTTVGYNGTTGALPVANNTDFWIKVRKRDNDAANRSQPMSLFAGPVKTDATGTQAELAVALVASGYRNFTNQEPANGYLKFEAISSAASAAITGAPTSFGVTYKSRVMTITGTATSNVAVGDFLRIGGAAVTNPVYRVTAVTATTITLATPYVGDSATILVANVQVIAAATASTANFGIRLTGVVAPFDVNAFRDYYANRWTTSFSDSSTLITVTGAQNGNGVWQQVAMDEYLNYGFEGENNQLAVPSVPRDQVVKIPGVAGNTEQSSRYSTLTFNWTEEILGLASVNKPQGSVLLHCNLTNVATGVITATTAEAVVDTLFSGAAATAIKAILNM